MVFREFSYTRVDEAGLRAEFASLTADLKAARSGGEAFGVHQRYYRAVDHAVTQMTLAEIRHDIDVTDAFYAKEQDYNDQLGPVFENLMTEYQKTLYASPYRGDVEKRIGPVAIRNMELAMKSVDPKIISLMQEENALETRYNKLLASAKIEWNGETLNLSLMTPYLSSPDRAVRQAAWDRVTAFYASNEEEIEEIYDRLIRCRTKQGEAMGYDTYLPLGDARMRRNCYGRDEMASFRKQVKEDLVPFAERIHETRRRRLGLDRLRYIDEGVYFTEGNPRPVGTPEEILAAGRKMYGELSPETGAFMDFMCEHELFDVLGRKTKKTGGYMTYLPDYKAPFIFANFNGTRGDVDVITHECGHAFQGYLAADDPIREHADITMETAETHSMSMEFFTEPWMELFFGRGADRYRQLHLEDSVIFIPYGTMVDEFQEIMYRNPALSPKDRNGVWLDLERQYRPHMDFEGCDLYERGAFWQKQHHIFDCPLYYIDYCIAGTDALEYKVWMDRDYKAAWASYLNLCRLSASGFFTDLIREAGLVSPFEDGCLRNVVNQLDH